jgi:ABC-type bacteriocin/lantibiotic exporter with double-glycine peptidase domain
VDRSPELPDIVLNVAPISQHGLFTTAEATENRACWYAACMMVLGYRSPLLPLELANLKTLVRLWQNDGVQPHHLDRLADEAGLEHTPAKSLFPRMGPAQWHACLSTLGPLLVVLNSRHMVVVRGIARSGDTWAIIYNDPFTGGSRSEILLKFNGSVDWRLPILFRRSAHRPSLVLKQPVTAPLTIRY